MRTAIECLAKASELEECAARCAVPAERVEFLDVAVRWRDLARRALIHEQRGALAQSKGRFGADTKELSGQLHVVPANEINNNEI